MSWAVLLVVAGSLVAAEPAKDDKAKMQGTWRIAEGEHDGTKLTEDATRGIKVVIEGDRYAYEHGSDLSSGTLTLDPTQTPKTLEVTTSDGEKRLGIYKIDDEKFEVCFADQGKERPTKFAAESDSGLSHYVMRRAKQ